MQDKKIATEIDNNNIIRSYTVRHTKNNTLHEGTNRNYVKLLDKCSLYPGSPHSSYSWTVSGREGSNMDVKISKNGTYYNDKHMPN